MLMSLLDDEGATPPVPPIMHFIRPFLKPNRTVCS